MPSATCLCSASSERRPGTRWSRQRSGGHHTCDHRSAWVIGGGFTRSAWMGLDLLLPLWKWRYLALRPVMGMALLRSAPAQGVSRPPHAASRDCRNGSPLARANPCAPAPEYGDTRKKEQAGKRLAKRCSRGVNGNPHPMSAHPHAAQRAVTGWRGGLGRVGADLASAGSMRPPPSPARHVSTAWLATTKASRETTRTSARLGTPPHTSARSSTLIQNE